MQKLRYGLISLFLLLCAVTTAPAQVSIGIGLPNVSIGISLPVFPELVPVPGYPVYYAPQVNGNYFFYDGMYWVYQDDNWYASSWYNGPWGLVGPEAVPVFILRIPVSYYRLPPVYFRGWQSNAPPRWGQHWGHNWENRRSGWDRWDRRSVPAPAPLPVYQRRYSGDRYPHQVDQQQKLRSQNYRYQPREPAVRQHFKQKEQRAPAASQRGRNDEPQMRSPNQREPQRSTPLRQGDPAGQRSQPVNRGDVDVQKSAPVQTRPQQREPALHDQKQPGAAQREQQAPRSQGREQRSQDKVKSQEPNQGHGQGEQKDEERGQGRNN